MKEIKENIAGIPMHPQGSMLNFNHQNQMNLSMQVPKRPMLASTCTDTAQLQYPVLATPKIDGIRCLTLPSEHSRLRSRPATRSYKPHQNTFVQQWLARYVPAGLDGELIVVDDEGNTLPFHELSGQLRNTKATPNFKFIVFDDFSLGLDMPYWKRVGQAFTRVRALPSDVTDRFEVLNPRMIASEDALLRYEEYCLKKGYEGVMVRAPRSPYKEGRATEREGWLLKIKRDVTDEAYIIHATESQENLNELETDAFGLAKRSTNREGMVGKGIVGSVVLKPVAQGKPTASDYAFITGNAHRLKAAVLEHPYYLGASFGTLAKGGNDVAMEDADKLNGRMVTFRHWPTPGYVGKPRFPQLVGWRDPEEIGL